MFRTTAPWSRVIPAVLPTSLRTRLQIWNGVSIVFLTSVREQRVTKAQGVEKWLPHLQDPRTPLKESTLCRHTRHHPTRCHRQLDVPLLTAHEATDCQATKNLRHFGMTATRIHFVKTRLPENDHQLLNPFDHVLDLVLAQKVRDVPCQETFLAIRETPQGQAVQLQQRSKLTTDALQKIPVL